MLHNFRLATTNYFFVLPIHDKNKYYKQCNRQIHNEWKKIRKSQLKKLETTESLPEYLIISSPNSSDRNKVIAYCSLSKIPCCAKRCLLEVIVRDDHCYYLNIENVFVGTRDLQVLNVKIKYSFYQKGIVTGKHYVLDDYGFCFEAREELPEIVKKFILTTRPNDWIAKEQQRLNEDLYYQRQNYYYYYYYNEDEDDDSYYQDRRVHKRIQYDGPPPPTSKEPYVVTPIHHHPELKEQCVRLMNYEWARSRMARFWSFESSTDTLPITLILAQMIDGLNTVLGHVKLSPVPADTNAVYAESLVVDYRYRGRGIGTHLMTEAENFCKKILNVNNVYLATDGQEYFYAKLGYIFCKAINIFGTNTTRNTSSKKHWMKKVISDWEDIYSDDVQSDESTNALNVPTKEENTTEQPERRIPNINELIRNIRTAVYNYSPVKEKEETIYDLVLTMHSL